ncbi:hypothetical protein AAFC00_006378 [Neodothiora populina]|uniref:Phytase A n=1 Tax=Neodothiora populina TaxID=2781224 RepID=A0ABR3P579_9PEZI
MVATCTFIGVFGLISSLSSAYTIPAGLLRNSSNHSGPCETDISHLWGQYSPFFSVPSEISAEVPPQCTITFAQVLSRHGARDPTASKTAAYNKTIAKIQAGSKNLTGKYAFISDYRYTLGADQLTTFGQQELVDSGADFYTRYSELARDSTPFVRSSGEARVVESAQNWTQGFTHAKIGDDGTKDYPKIDVVIPEADGLNNTLNHGLCTSFEAGHDSGIASDAQKQFANVFVPPLQARLSATLGVNLTQTEAIYVMDLCPFNTVASPNGEISAFCDLFTTEEWRSYDYYLSLNKFYGYGSGNPLGPTQGVGFSNELIARMTGKPVVDHTSTNSSLDGSGTSFPLGRPLYADFSHDSDMTSIFFALGLYNDTAPLSNTTVEPTTQTNGYSSAWTVPFAARAYFEKMQCVGHEERVRVIINDRVLPLRSCGSDAFGTCTLSSFVDSLTFVENGGNWNQCLA